MSIVLANNTLLSFIAALDLSKNSGRDVYLKSDIPEHFGRYFSINEFSKIYEIKKNNKMMIKTTVNFFKINLMFIICAKINKFFFN